MEAKCKQHHDWLRTLALTSVEAAESACLAHIRTEGQLTCIHNALQDKIAKASYAAAAVDRMTSAVQLSSPSNVHQSDLHACP